MNYKDSLHLLSISLAKEDIGKEILQTNEAMRKEMEAAQKHMQTAKDHLNVLIDEYVQKARAEKKRVEREEQRQLEKRLNAGGNVRRFPDRSDQWKLREQRERKEKPWQFKGYNPLIDGEPGA
jgi:hypothetical protein